MLGRQGSISERMLVPAPQVYISKAAEDMIPRAVLHRARSTTDSFKRAIRMIQLPEKVPGLKRVRVNGLQVIGPAREDSKNRTSRIYALRQICQYGIEKRDAEALYKAFGDAALEMAGEVRDYMIMPNPNGSHMEKDLLEKRLAQTRQGLAELAERHKIAIGAEGLEMLMVSSGISYCQLRDILDNFEKTAYVSKAYDVDMQTAAFAREMAASSDGLESLEDLKSRDLTMYVEAASASAEKERAFGLRNNNWFPLSGRKRSSLQSGEAAEAAQRLGLCYECSADPVIDGIRYTGGGTKLEEAIDGCAFDVDSALEQ